MLIKNGIPLAQIIVMAYDDIANNTQNPFPGKIFNEPDFSNATDIYQGCKIDYRKSNCTKDNLLNVLTGNTTAGPSLKSN